LQLHFEQAPPGIEHGLCHPGLHQLSAAHIAYDYLLILIHDLTTELVQRILAPVRRSSMVALGLPGMTSALGLGDLLLHPPIEVALLAARPVARDRHVL
jgi:hypothetical protein